VTDALGLSDATPAVVTVNVNAAQAPVVSDMNVGSVGSTMATVTWTTDTAADSQVLFRPVGDTVDQQTPIETAQVTSHSVDVTGLMPGTEYEYSVRSTDGNGLTTTQSSASTFTTQTNNFTYLRIEAESAPISNPAEVRTGDGSFANAYIRLAPGSGTGTANNPNGTWDLGFNVPAPATWYVWFRMYAPNSSSSDWYEQVNGGGFARIAPTSTGAWEWVAGRSYGLSAGVHVLTLGGGDAQARIDRVLITNDAAFLPTEAPGGDVTPPSTVSALSALGDDGSVALSWSNPSESGAMRVVVRYSTGSSHPAHPDDGSPLIDRPATSGAADSVLHTGLTNGTTYRYSVFVIDEWGNASGPSTVTATPQAPVEPLGQVGNLRRTDTLSN
jgi:chitodextrinase